MTLRASATCNFHLGVAFQLYLEDPSRPSSGLKYAIRIFDRDSDDSRLQSAAAALQGSSSLSYREEAYRIQRPCNSIELHLESRLSTPANPRRSILFSKVGNGSWSIDLPLSAGGWTKSEHLGTSIPHVIISDMFAEATLSMKLACLDGSSSSLRDIALKLYVASDTIAFSADNTPGIIQGFQPIHRSILALSKSKTVYEKPPCLTAKHPQYHSQRHECTGGAKTTYESEV